jgi:hypothetical protein
VADARTMIRVIDGSPLCHVPKRTAPFSEQTPTVLRDPKSELKVYL